MKLIDNIPVWGTPVDEGALSQIKNCAKTASHVALMGDHHKGYAVPIGGVVAYEDSISPSDTTTITSPGKKSTKGDAFGWSARVLRLPFRARRGSSEAQWVISP